MTRARGRGRTPAWAAALSLAAVIAVATTLLHAATDVEGRATFNGTPLPGATVTATQGDAHIVTTTDADGECRLSLGDGEWTIEIAMRGFASIRRDVAVDVTRSLSWDMTLLPAESLPARQPGRTTPPAASERAPAPAPDASPSPAPDPATADGLVVNGSVLNAAASPFAQMPAFGNNRPGRRGLFNGSLGLLGGNSAWDARPYAFSTDHAPTKPDYSDVQFASTFAGPVPVPFVRGARTLLNLGYQRSSVTTANTVSSRVPTSRERAGDFSSSRDAGGNPVTIVDPSSGAAFPNATIPSGRLSPQALALLAFYPQANVDDAGSVNYETALTERTRRDALQVRAGGAPTLRQQLSLSLSYQRADTSSLSLFRFVDRSHAVDLTAEVSWSYRFSPTRSLRTRYQFVGGSMAVHPFFADREDVSADAGIAGSDRAPGSWGPPHLAFASGLAGLSSVAPASRDTRTHVAFAEFGWLRGHHSVTFGGEWRGRRVSDASKSDPRGTFTFTGAATGDDFADFLLGLPQASAISFGDGRILTGSLANAYVMDDWGLASGVTINAGVRWEYEGPMTERKGRLANLDLAPDFSAATAVSPASPTGSLTGRRYSSALLDRDLRGVEPRLGVAWRPLAASSLLIRGGYGIYRQTNIYLPIATWLSQQPPFSTTATTASTAERPLTLADGLGSSPDAVPNTVAVDPALRVGYAETWQMSAQRDLPASLTVAASYLGTRGHHLLRESLPNTVPPGAAPMCVSCPIGFIDVTSDGSSSRHALQVQVRRRLRSGFRASVQYTLASAKDNAAAMAGVSASGAAIVQDWRDPDADWGPSAFDQRHLATGDVEYTTGVGIRGGALLRGMRARLFKGWVFAGQISTGSGLPLTPRSLAPVPGTGVTGTVRASVVPVARAAPAGYFLDPAAFAAPAAGAWGTAGRNSARGPASFSLNASLGRSFVVTERMTLDWRLDATNVLNRVTYVDVNAWVGSPQFGLPDRAASMRKIRMSLRWRF